MELLLQLISTTVATIVDALPILIILIGFQYLVIRKKLYNLKQISVGFTYILIGLSLFIVGLEQALFPLGKTMATQLVESAFVENQDNILDWKDYTWVYIFAAAIGFATTIAEPALIAVSLKAEEISGGAVQSWGLRIVVAIGVAIGVSVGTYRIVSGTPLPLYIMVGYIVVIIQTYFASKEIIPLAYDSGGVTTSTVTVPVVTALGLGLASSVPGRSPLIDGFGLIAFASVFPIMSVLAYVLLIDWFRSIKVKNSS